MALRLIHTADVHLDAVFRGLGAERGDRKREAIRNTFRRIIDDCVAWPADMLVVAGDLFEDERVMPDTIAFLKHQFARLKDTPVVIAPGNHDPCTVKSPYSIADWGANVRVFTKGTAAGVRFDSLGLEVIGVAHVSTHMSGRLVDAVSPARRDGGLAVLVTHASEETVVPHGMESDVWLPFRREELARLGYAYIALGHYHRHESFEEGGRVIAAYPGAPEGLRFGEDGPRQYARVTLDRDGAKVEYATASEIEFLALDITCDGFETREQFYDAVRKHGVRSPGRVIARVTATGRVAPGFRIEGELPEDIRESFFHVEYRDETLPAYDWEAIASERSLRGEAARMFAAEMEGADAARREVMEKARIYAMDALEGRQPAVPAEVFRVD